MHDKNRAEGTHASSPKTPKRERSSILRSSSSLSQAREHGAQKREPPAEPGFTPFMLCISFQHEKGSNSTQNRALFYTNSTTQNRKQNPHLIPKVPFSITNYALLSSLAKRNRRDRAPEASAGRPHEKTPPKRPAHSPFSARFGGGRMLLGAHALFSGTRAGQGKAGQNGQPSPLEGEVSKRALCHRIKGSNSSSNRHASPLAHRRSFECLGGGRRHKGFSRAFGAYHQTGQSSTERAIVSFEALYCIGDYSTHWGNMLGNAGETPRTTHAQEPAAGHPQDQAGKGACSHMLFEPFAAQNEALPNERRAHQGGAQRGQHKGTISRGECAWEKGSNSGGKRPGNDRFRNTHRATAAFASVSRGRNRGAWEKGPGMSRGWAEASE